MKGTTVLVLFAAVAVVAANPARGSRRLDIIPGPGLGINPGPEIVPDFETPIVVEGPEEERDEESPIVVHPEVGGESPIVVDPEVGIESPIVVDPEVEVETPIVVDPEVGEESPIVVNPEIDVESPIVVDPEVDEKPEEEFLANGCPIDPHVHWLLPNEQDCNRFYACVWGEKTPRQCAASLHFNKEIQVCDWPSEAGCAA